MRRDAPVERAAYVHAGTHKTGTTSIQRFLAANAAAASLDGVLYPMTARLSAELPAHTFRAALHDGRAADVLAAMLAEMRRAAAARIVLSSEALSAVVDFGSLAQVTTPLAGAGYRPRIVVYLRPQADRIESLYATSAINGAVEPYADFLEDALERGESRRARSVYRFAYGPMLDAMSRVDAVEIVVVRRYRGGPPDRLLLDFVDAIGGGQHLAAVAREHPVASNTRPATGWLIRRLFARTAELTGDAASASAAEALIESDPEASAQPFRPLSTEDRERIAARFAADNREVAARWGVDPAPERVHEPETGAGRRAREMFALAERLRRPHVEALTPGARRSFEPYSVETSARAPGSTE